MMKEQETDMMKAYADADDEDNSITLTEASLTDTSDIDEDTDIPRDSSSYASIAKPSTVSVLVAILAVLAASSCSKHLASFFTWYLATLETAPLTTKCVTGALLAVVGDYCAQWFECKTMIDEHQRNQELVYECQNTASLLSIRGKYDYRRGWATALETFLVSCPLQHYAYDYFESILPIQSGTELYRSFAAMVHVLFDCLALDAVFVASGIIIGGVFEGHSLHNYVLPNLNRTYFAALRAALITNLSFAPVEFLSFRFLPLSLRVLSVNAVDLVWNGVVSFASHGGAVVEQAAA
eukprot:CAMPEP_0201695438 /NCGR_PEP_ID=MMETSP0578-20130828/7385_1 /ASSEMBLY_ACC=CAM_ASM_000663 /TAXON_ID=267565 /ORGANISM="Skeletonema grethea, Strain CCMP 1804" /LENGTH=294 /DNA_ID=CAMNT_0048181283 /DNA_START=77 /DNA_END=961 /DNA_ORIENTATION=-